MKCYGHSLLFKGIPTNGKKFRKTVNMSGFKGKCLCGGVTYTSLKDPIISINCHCEDCRKSTGSVFGTNVFVNEEQIEIIGELTQYTHLADSGNIMTKMFCPNCGSLVAGTNSGRPNVVSIRAGTIDNLEIINPSVNVFLESRVPTTFFNKELACWPRMPKSTTEWVETWKEKKISKP